MPIIEQELRQFVIDSFMFGQQDTAFSNEDSFLEKGLIDSTGVLELVAFLEQTYGFKLQDDEVTPENLDSVDRIAKFVQRKTQIRVEI